MTYDYVIIGGGSAGCVLANRLSADPGLKVALLEAGPRDKNFLIHMPAGYPALMKTGIVDWGYNTEPQAGMNGRAAVLAARPGARRVEFRKRHDLYKGRAERLRRMGAAWQSRLVLGRCPALFQEVGDLSARG